jgi:phenylacetate-CoA ligase
MSRLLTLYHHLPPPARNLAATLRGYYLRSWRYGPETERLVEEALERERWSAEQWKRWQEERLAYVLHRAATQVPYYRQQWEERRRRGDTASWEILENWPVLDKEPLRAHPQAFVADDCDIRRMFHEHTSGTTGKPLDLWWSRETVRAWYALFEARWRRWYGVSRHDRWAILGGQLVVPVTQTKPPFWVWNAALHQLYMSSYHLSPSTLGYYLQALREHEIVYLLGYTSALYELACGALDQGQDDLVFRVVIANAEPVYPYQREAIEKAFHCPLRETYGMAEIVAAAGECEAHVLHLWPEVGWVEILEGETSVESGTSGDIVATGLFNADMPLIRYRVGDRAALNVSADPCPCGRNLPALASLEGRSDDVLYTRDGRRIGRLDPVFKAHLPIREAQIVQETLDRVRVRYVPADGFGAADARSIVERLRQRMGDIEFILEPTDSIPRGPNGKFRAVICQLPPEERERVTKNG